MFYVYLLQSLKDNCFYIGQTNNVHKRLEEHNLGLEKSTKYRRPFKLVGYETYETRGKALWRETELKKSAHKCKKFFDQFRPR